MARELSDPAFGGVSSAAPLAAPPRGDASPSGNGGSSEATMALDALSIGPGSSAESAPPASPKVGLPDLVSILVVEDDEFMRDTLASMLEGISDSTRLLHRKLGLPPFEMRVELSSTGARCGDPLERSPTRHAAPPRAPRPRQPSHVTRSAPHATRREREVPP